MFPKCKLFKIEWEIKNSLFTLSFLNTLQWITFINEFIISNILYNNHTYIWRLMDGKEWDLVSTPSQSSLRQNTAARPTPKFFPQAQTFSTKKVNLHHYSAIYFYTYIYIHHLNIVLKCIFNSERVIILNLRFYIW